MRATQIWTRSCFPAVPCKVISISSSTVPWAGNRRFPGWVPSAGVSILGSTHWTGRTAGIRAPSLLIQQSPSSLWAQSLFLSPYRLPMVMHASPRTRRSGARGPRGGDAHIKSLLSFTEDQWRHQQFDRKLHIDSPDLARQGKGTMTLVPINEWISIPPGPVQLATIVSDRRRHESFGNSQDRLSLLTRRTTCPESKAPISYWSSRT